MESYKLIRVNLEGMKTLLKKRTNKWNITKHRLYITVLWVFCQSFTLVCFSVQTAYFAADIDEKAVGPTV